MIGLKTPCFSVVILFSFRIAVYCEPVIITFGDLQQGFKECPCVGDITLVAEYFGKCKVVKGRDNRVNAGNHQPRPAG